MTTLFIGRPGAITVTRRQEAPRRRPRFWWSLPGSRIERGPFRHELDALIAAAHDCRMSGARADFVAVDRADEDRF